MTQCSTSNCGNFAVSGGKCHDCLDEAYEPLLYKCMRCGTPVIEYTIPYCPTCKQHGDFEDTPFCMPQTVSFTKPDNHKFCEQMAQAIQDLGPEEALSCMARMMIGIAHTSGNDLEFNCEMGLVSVERNSIPKDQQN